MRVDADGVCCSTTPFGRLDSSAPHVSSLESILKLTDELILDATAVRHALSLGPPLRKPDSDPSQRHPTSLVLRTAALSFYESTILLPLELDLPVVILPSPAFTYLCLLSSELMSVSRICGIVARCARSSSLVAPRPASADALLLLPADCARHSPAPTAPSSSFRTAPRSTLARTRSRRSTLSSSRSSTPCGCAASSPATGQ